MKKLLFAITLILTGWIADDPVPLTPSVIKDKKEQCKTEVDAYFYKYGFLLGTKKTGEEKDAIIEEIQNNFFLDNTVRIESDDNQLHKKRYDAKEYHDDIAEMYGEINGNVKTNIKNLSDVYFDSSKNYYFIVAYVEKEIIVDQDNQPTHADTTKKLIDIYFSFTLQDRKPKIFSIQNHQDNALANLTPVQVVADENNENDQSKSYLVFNIYPANAEIKIDGAPVVYANGQKLQTTPGVHKIIIQSDSYKTDFLTATLNDKSIITINRNLLPKEGMLNVNPVTAFDFGAIVLLNNVQIGTVPLKNFPLAVGDYKLRITKGNLSKICRVNIFENRNTNLNAAIASGGFLRAYIDNNFIYVNATVVPNFYFNDPAYHTYRGQITHPYYSHGAVYRFNSVRQNGGTGALNRGFNGIPSQNRGQVQPRNQLQTRSQYPQRVQTQGRPPYQSRQQTRSPYQQQARPRAGSSSYPKQNHTTTKKSHGT